MYFQDSVLSDDYLFGKVLAAEKDAERRLRVYLEPVEMVPDGTDVTVTDAFDAASIRWAEEPAYDYDKNYFQGDNFGYLVTRQKPIISVSSFVIAFPTQRQPLFSVPDDWVRLDKKYGHIRLVPYAAGALSSLHLNSFALSALSAGRNLPHVIRVRYLAGLKDAINDYPDLVDTIKRMAVLRIINDSFMPSSGSISADGLSQSLSFDGDKYEAAIEKTLDTLRDSIHGIRMTFL